MSCDVTSHNLHYVNLAEGKQKTWDIPCMSADYLLDATPLEDPSFVHFGPEPYRIP
jgi:hypothetical protein